MVLKQTLFQSLELEYEWETLGTGFMRPVKSCEKLWKKCTLFPGFEKLWILWKSRHGCEKLWILCFVWLTFIKPYTF